MIWRGSLQLIHLELLISLKQGRKSKLNRNKIRQSRVEDIKYHREINQNRVAVLDSKIEAKDFARTLAKSHLLEGIKQVY